MHIISRHVYGKCDIPYSCLYKIYHEKEILQSDRYLCSQLHYRCSDDNSNYMNLYFVAELWILSPSRDNRPRLSYVCTALSRNVTLRNPGKAAAAWETIIYRDRAPLRNERHKVEEDKRSRIYGPCDDPYSKYILLSSLCG